jgi:hypothetical protein
MDDAVETIVRVMSGADAQASIRTALVSRAELFSAHRFVAKIRGIVARVLARRCCEPIGPIARHAFELDTVPSQNLVRRDSVVFRSAGDSLPSLGC